MPDERLADCPTCGHPMIHHSDDGRICLCGKVCNGPEVLCTQARERFVTLGHATALQLLVTASEEGVPLDMRDPSSRSAMQAFIEGFLETWRMPKDRADAILAAFNLRVAQELQQERTKS